MAKGLNVFLYIYSTRRRSTSNGKLSVPMNVTEVEVHRRPQLDDDDEDHSDNGSPPIEVGAGQLNTAGNNMNPLAPNVKMSRSPSNNIEEGGHANQLAVNGEGRRTHRSPRIQCEIEIERVNTSTQRVGGRPRKRVNSRGVYSTVRLVYLSCGLIII
ncbi:hypothetical protein KIN20_014903 [Parelaphostrongylus tenuis]|uniref:Uncharacterized protein n=1 Tax=Parelaphostrongylus tenuis TaxID=148309 RepID=A0AAD5MIS0_PARTN|nr:hypothetical protein KIN20_014903 [Parelaphostrongylus tenuis]